MRESWSETVNSLIIAVAICSIALSLIYAMYKSDVEGDAKEVEMEKIKAIHAEEQTKAELAQIEANERLEHARIKQIDKLSGHMEVCINDLCGVCTFKPQSISREQKSKEAHER